MVSTPTALAPVPAAPAPGRTRRRGLVVGLVVLAVVLAGVCGASIAVGAKSIPLDEVWRALVHHDPHRADDLIVRSLRVPRTVVGLVVGAALGLAGAVMQGITRNPLADPGILGVNAGAALAIVIGIHSFGVASPGGFVWFGFVGAAGAAVLVYALGAMGRDGATPIKLALSGAAMTVFLTSVSSAVLLSDLATLDQYRFWVVGSLAARDGDIVRAVVPFAVVGLVLALTSARLLNGLALGDDVAIALGYRVERARLLAAIAVVLLCGAAVAAAGPIAFVGLTVPHVARAVTGPDYRWILPYSAMLGALLVLTADIVGRVIAPPGEVQAGIVIALVGAPFFVALVRRRRLAAL
jgi:iron complex transport system permease protein